MSNNGQSSKNCFRIVMVVLQVIGSIDGRPWWLAQGQGLLGTFRPCYDCRSLSLCVSVDDSAKSDPKEVSKVPHLEKYCYFTNLSIDFNKYVLFSIIFIWRE